MFTAIPAFRGILLRPKGVVWSQVLLSSQLQRKPVLLSIKDPAPRRLALMAASTNVRSAKLQIMGRRVVTNLLRVLAGRAFHCHVPMQLALASYILQFSFQPQS